MTTLVSGLSFIRGMAFDLAGNLYVSDADLNGIMRIGGFPQGTLSGVVTNSSGESIGGARVQVLAVDPNVVGQDIFTDAQGRFSLAAAPRMYSVYADMLGYSQGSLAGVQIFEGSETIVEISLNP